MNATTSAADEADTDVLIVGAGPTGLTLAVELALRGIRFRLIDAAPGPQPGSRGKGVQPRTLEVLDSLGAVEPLIAHGRFAMPIVMTAPDGSERRGGGEPAELAGRPDIPYSTSLTTPEWRMEQTLRDRLVELGGGSPKFGTALVSIEQSDDRVTATVSRDGVTSILTARWLVGADGGHSVTLKQVGIPFEGETREDVRMIVADVALENLAELTPSGFDADAWHMWRHPTGFAGLCPLPSTDVFQLQLSVAPGQDASLTRENLQALLDEQSGGSGSSLSPRLADPEWTTLWRANIRLAQRYCSGRVFLAGDAAHIHPPTGGQGMNTGIQDAHNLGFKLAAVVRGADAALLDTYEEERRPIAAGVLAFSDARLAQAQKEGGIPIRRDASTTQLDVSYRGSSLVADDRPADADLRAGDRAPDATDLVTADGVRRLFDLTRGGGATVLAFGDAADDGIARDGVRVLRVVATADERASVGEPAPVGGPATPASGVIVDRAGHLAAAYATTDSTIIAIRPDGVIGLISDAGDASAAAAYLTRLA